ncbi:MAG: hypothetical protein WC867_02040 [Candidatus Pacearchaeota archaeon]|jgi:hypothetical protein
MVDIKKIQALAQLVADMENSIKKMEKSFSDNDAKNFNSNKKDALDYQNRVSGILNELKK